MKIQNSNIRKKTFIFHFYIIVEASPVLTNTEFEMEAEEKVEVEESEEQLAEEQEAAANRAVAHVFKLLLHFCCV